MNELEPLVLTNVYIDCQRIIVKCPKCKTKYSLYEDNLGLEKRRVKCSKCDNEWNQPRLNKLERVDITTDSSNFDDIEKYFKKTNTIFETTHSITQKMKGSYRTLVLKPEYDGDGAEPSMEDILASIRRILTEEDDDMGTITRSYYVSNPSVATYIKMRWHKM